MRSAWNWILVLATATILTIGCTNGGIYSNENNVSSKNVEETIDYRLPTTIIPYSYKIMLELPIDENSTIFEGTVLIDAIVDAPTNVVVFHVGKINVTYCKIVDPNDKSLSITNHTYNATTEKYSNLLSSTLTKGRNIMIAIKYRGTLRDDMIGFYRSSYIDENNNPKWLAATQFQTTHARHAFPCFDEPSFKATFTIRIRRSKKFQCLSNMRLLNSTETPDGLVWDTFDTSVRMSTYLVAFVISDFSPLANTNGNFTVWARPNAIHQAEYALNIGPRALQYLSKLFNTDYQLAKMDMVAIPDFAAGAMENWGLVTYRESRLLYDENESSVSSEQDVASVIVHECTHMWLGNLVTPQWWSYLWLSEAFARYYQYAATSKLEPNWKMEQQFVVEQLQSIFAADSLDSSNPMTRNNISSQAEIGMTGDTITYAKGASVVRMMELSFGSDVFNSALQEYLQKKKYSSATPEDLWSALQHQAELKGLKLLESVETIMNTWTRQAGYPVLSVSIVNGIAILRQQRFFLRNSKSSPMNTTWWIPITWTTGKNPNFHSTSPNYWLGNKSAEIPTTNDENQWIVFNVQEAGYYRVNYDRASWYRIIDILKSENFTDIHEINRAAIVDDTLNLARAGLLDYETALTALNYIKQETNYLPFKAAFRGLEYLHKRFNNRPNYDYIRSHSLSIIKYIYNNLGYVDRDDDDRLTILLRNEVNNWACRLGHQECIEKSRYYFDNWRVHSKRIPKNQRTAAYCTAVRTGSTDDWDFLWEQYLKSNCAAEQIVILKALGCSQNTTILEKFLLKAITKFETSGIRKQDSTTAFSGVYNSGLVGAQYILDFIRKHHLAMADYYGNYNTIGTILSGASSYFSTDELVAKFATFVHDYSKEFESIEKSLNDSLELAKYELDWYEKNENDIISWMKKNSKIEPVIDTNNTTDYRLPTSLLPVSYVIKVTPYIEPDKFNFDGSVKITAYVAEPTTKIVLHVDEINPRSIQLSVDGKHLEITGKKLEKKYNFFTISLGETLVVGKTLIIKIVYEGQLNKIMKGFYRSSYIDNAGKTRWLAATHLEPVGARKMFPCFDEPALKATFVLSVNRSATYNAISNTPLKSSVPDGVGRVLDTFEETPIMSTYLLALVVSDFESLVDAENNYSTWARSNAIEQSRYALSMISPIVKFFENSLKQPYQLRKLDMVALPDFSSGAMENWGLLTYKEFYMLYDERHSPITSKQSITIVICHEISHQWFGNLVTPRWWKYLWLSESFARYFQYHGTEEMEEKWELPSQFVVDQLHSAFDTDASHSSHPMTHDVYSPSEIRDRFNKISYAKGASVLRMIEKTFGSKLFYDALQDYLEARKYWDATPEHLFQAFQGQIDSTGTMLETTIKTIMNTWTMQAGYPVINVKIDGTIATLEQKRFFLKKTITASEEYVWWIPITWASKSNPDFTNTSAKYWLSKKGGSVKLNVSDEWIIFNVQQTGYYRVNYDMQSWNRIINLLKSDDFEIIHEINRASIINDLMTFGRAEQVDYKTVLSATQYLSTETNYIPWRAAFNGLDYLNRQFVGKDIYELYKTHILTILKPIYDKLGFDELSTESYYDKLLRRYVIDWACKFQVKSCITASLKYFAEWKADKSKLVPVNLRNAIYCTAIKYGTINDWEFLWDQYTSTNVNAEKIVILKALGCSNNKKLLEKILTNAITDNSEIRLQDSASAFSGVYTSGIFGAEYALDFIERNYTQMYHYYGDYKNIEKILKGICARLTTEELVIKFEKFWKKHETNLDSIRSLMNKLLKRAQTQLVWYENNSPTIYAWLDTTYPTEDYRLPKKIYPEQYNIYLTPYLDNFTFDGEIRMVMDVRENTSSIVLQANELTIKNIIVYENSVKILQVSSYAINSTTHRFTIYLKNIVIAGSKISAYITYTGGINDKMNGFYRSSYVDKNGTTRWLASTKFEPVYARKAFPCFDEPAFKAKFTIHIERPDDYRTLSNMPQTVSISSTTSGRTWDSYETSVPMSSYLVAFVVSDFKSLTNERGNFSIWGRPEVVEYGSYALNVGQRVLEFFENFTGIDYPIRKMDFVALPDFLSGAMENWSLITFREYGLLQRENVTSATYKKYLNSVVAHELVHMWFGNLVTCEWWDYVWLQEGFAQYLEYIAGDYVSCPEYFKTQSVFGAPSVSFTHNFHVQTEPEWDLLQQFVVYELQVAMANDASPKIHPMNNNVTKPLDIAKSFDKIAYAKSASVIRMMHHALGNKVFESSLRTYLEKNIYKNAKPENLWSSFHENIENSSSHLNETIFTLTDSWTNKAGYPVINATWKSNLLTISQQRFFLNRPDIDSDELITEYWIPITLTTKRESNFNDTSPKFWLGTKRSNTSLVLNTDEWFIINIQETGYYRVNYDEGSWLRLAVGLQADNFDGIHPLNRAQIIDDLLNLARSDYVSYDLALTITKYLEREENHLPWRAFFNGITFLNQRFDGHEIGEHLADYVLLLMQRIYEKMGFHDSTNENQLHQLNRQLILTWSCKFGHSGCHELSRKFFDDWREDEKKWISVNARPAVYCTSIKHGNHEDWNFLWKQYEKTDFASEKIVILNALGCSRNITTIDQYFKLAISSDKAIRDQDVATVFSSVYNADRYGVDMMMEFLTINYIHLREYYGNWRDVGNLFSDVAERISTETQIERFELFVNNSSSDMAEITESLRSAVKKAKQNFKWFETHAPGINVWLTKALDTSESGGKEESTIAPNSSVFVKSSMILIFAVFFSPLFHSFIITH